jgi:hypothetical protein
MKNEIRKQDPLTKEDYTEMMEQEKCTEEIDEEYFRTHLPEGYESDVIDYDYIWSCEPQVTTPFPEPQIFVGQIYDGFTRELFFHTFLKTTLTSPSGTTRTFVKYIYSRSFPDVDEE